MAETDGTEMQPLPDALEMNPSGPIYARPNGAPPPVETPGRKPPPVPVALRQAHSELDQMRAEREQERAEREAERDENARLHQSMKETQHQLVIAQVSGKMGMGEVDSALLETMVPVGATREEVQAAAARVTEFKQQVIEQEAAKAGQQIEALKIEQAARLQEKAQFAMPLPTAPPLKDAFHSTSEERAANLRAGHGFMRTP